MIFFTVFQARCAKIHLSAKQSWSSRSYLQPRRAKKGIPASVHQNKCETIDFKIVNFSTSMLHLTITNFQNPGHAQLPTAGNETRYGRRNPLLQLSSGFFLVRGCCLGLEFPHDRCADRMLGKEKSNCRSSNHPGLHSLSRTTRNNLYPGANLASQSLLIENTRPLQNISLKMCFKSPI